MRTETFSLDLGHRWRSRAVGVALVVDGLYFPEEDTIVIHVFFNQPDANSSTVIEGNPHFAFRFVLRPRARFAGNKARGLLPWTPPGATAEDPPLGFAENITRHLGRMGIDGGRLDVTFVPYDPDGRLRSAALELKGGVSLRFEDR